MGAEGSVELDAIVEETDVVRGTDFVIAEEVITESDVFVAESSVVLGTGGVTELFMFIGTDISRGTDTDETAVVGTDAVPELDVLM